MEHSPPNYQSRVRAEKTELDDKLTKLAAFFTTDIFKAMERADQDLLMNQETVMVQYSQILGKRIERF